MANNKKERKSPQTNLASPALSQTHNGVTISVSFAQSAEHPVTKEEIMEILYNSFERRVMAVKN